MAEFEVRVSTEGSMDVSIVSDGPPDNFNIDQITSKIEEYESDRVAPSHVTENLKLVKTRAIELGLYVGHEMSEAKSDAQ